MSSGTSIGGTLRFPCNISDNGATEVLNFISFSCTVVALSVALNTPRSAALAAQSCYSTTDGPNIVVDQATSARIAYSDLRRSRHPAFCVDSLRTES
jgi:hypothetical protein